jgi:hypothetical protein
VYIRFLCSGLTQKDYTMLERLAGDQHTPLLSVTKKNSFLTLKPVLQGWVQPGSDVPGRPSSRKVRNVIQLFFLIIDALA